RIRQAPRKAGSPMRREMTDSVPDPGKPGLGPARARVRRVRLCLVNGKLVALTVVAMISLAWFSDVDSGRTPPELTLARGEPQTLTTALACSPDGTTIATTHEDGRVALRSSSEGWSLQRFLGYREPPVALAFSPDGQLLALGGFEPDITLCDLSMK